MKLIPALAAAFIDVAPIPAPAQSVFEPWINGTAENEPQMQVQR